MQNNHLKRIDELTEQLRNETSPLLRVALLVDLQITAAKAEAADRHEVRVTGL